MRTVSIRSNHLTRTKGPDSGNLIYDNTVEKVTRLVTSSYSMGCNVGNPKKKGCFVGQGTLKVVT